MCSISNTYSMMNKNRISLSALLIVMILYASCSSKSHVPVKEAKDIRNKIDAHKDDSFVTQIALYKKCDWEVSVVNLSVFVMLIDKIQLYMGIIHHNVSVLYDQYYAFMKERMKQYEEILKQLQEFQEPVSEITKDSNI